MTKNYYIQYNIGKVKYAVSYHNGVSTHKDGSAFYDIYLTNNKRKLEKFVRELKKDGYVERTLQLR